MVQQPTLAQTQFLLLEHFREVFFGGAVGGGKSSALLLAALQFVDVPGYAALVLRRTFADLALPGALLDRAKDWLMPTGARWSERDKTWTFPSGATLSFGYLEHEDDKYRYQSSEFQYVAFDELTQFTETQYRYLFSRLRRLADSDVPLRMRAASNPGGLGHAWVKKRFLSGARGRVFLPARLDDNPHLDREAYLRSLAELDPLTRTQLLDGDWNAFECGRFQRAWFRRYRIEDDRAGPRYRLDGRDQAYSAADCWRFCTVDPAASEKETADYTVIGTFAVTPRRDLLVLDVVRRRLALDAIVPAVADVCARYQPAFVGMEATGFQLALVQAARQHAGIPTVRALEPRGTGKLARATPAILRCEAGQVFLPETAPWLEDFEAELIQFTGDDRKDAHDDQVDVLAYAVQQLDLCAFEAPRQPEARERPNLQPTRQARAARRGLFGR